MTAIWFTEQLRLQSQNNRLAKVAVIGECSTGKSTLIHKLISGDFLGRQKPTASVVLKMLNLMTDSATNDNDPVEVWDTPGDARYASLTPLYTRDAHLLVGVFDASRPETLRHTIDLLKTCRRSCRKENQGILLVTTKWDIRSAELVWDEVISLARQVDAELLAVSAKTGENISVLLDRVVLKAASSLKHEEDKPF